mgnify:CR=1 FL=1
MRVLVCGGRNFDDAMTLGAWLGGIHKQAGITALIHGGAKGADFMAGKFAEWAGIPVEVFPADWVTHGRRAGPIRNAKMLNEGAPDLVVAFEGGRGTADMVRKAKAAGVRVQIATKVTEGGE